MSFVGSENVSPRESLEHEWEVESRRESFAQEKEIALINRETKKLELQLKQEDATLARKHQEHMKELELEIRRTEVVMGQWIRIPVLILRLPLTLCLGIGYIVAAIRGEEITSRDFWTFLR